ncbi:MAG TPA: insulinase family protein, partial [Saprospiraceae bacterium]|nr:insulinase family protein [Saprospiraceae bacterium]
IEKVTPDDVYNVAKKYLKPSNRTLGIFVPTQNPDRAIIPEAPNVEDLVKNYKGRKEIAAGEAFDPSPENIQHRTENIQLKNGAQIALLKKENRGNSVTARIKLRYGSLKSLAGKATAAEITADMLNKGTKTMTRQQIQDKLDALKARVRFYGGYSGVTVSIETENEFLDETLQLVFDLLKNPAFPKEEFDKLIQEDLAQIESQQSDPQAIANYEIQKLSTAPYPKDDPRYVSSFEEDIAAYKGAQLEDAVAFHKNFYGGSNATVSVVGDFDESKIKNTLSDELSNWNNPTPYHRIKNKFYDAKPVNKNINTPDKANAMFFVNQNLKLSKNDPDYPALTLGNFMLGGGFLNSRLATRIRQKEGLSYGVGSWLYGSDLDQVGGFGSYAIYAPENVKKLEKAYNEEIAKMLKDGFTDEEVEAAKSGWLQKQVVNRSSDRNLSRTLESNLFVKKDMLWTKKFEQQVKNLTTTQINAAMKKYVKPEKFIMVKAGDFQKADAKP